MTQSQPIPVFTLYGETAVFPDVVHCERFSARAPIHDWRIAAHRHSHMAQVFFIEEGQVEAQVDGQDLSLGDGTFLFVPAQAAHEFVFRPDTGGLVVSVPQSVVRTIGPAQQDILAALMQPLHGVASPRLQALLAMLDDIAGPTHPFRDQMAVGLVHAALAEVAAEAVSAGRVDGRLSELDSLIQTHMAQGWSAADYARTMALSTGHLSRICRAASGLGASAYIERAIMIEASRLLAFTRLPVSEIGFRLGFADPSYFAKRFRRFQGQSPSDYRAQFAG